MPNTVRTVYVVQDSPGKNLEPAKRHGRLHVMLKGREPIDVAHEKMAKILRDIRLDDSLLLIGNPIFIGLAIHEALMMQEQVNVLVWDGESYEYNQVTINANQYPNR